MTVHGVPSPLYRRVTSWQCDRDFSRELCRHHAEALARVASLLLGDDDAADEVVSDTTMTDTQRAVVALVLFGDHDLTQASTTLNLSPAAVTRHLRDVASILGDGSPVR
jgi:DNA-directed RNA polymerase specialized sigma24 family protein